MGRFEWNEQLLGLGVPAIDNEHKQLIQIMNGLHERSKGETDHAETGKILMELANSMRRHFANEEQYMQSINYPEFNAHKKIHDQLLARLESFGPQFESGTGHRGDEIFNFLKVWLSVHIQAVDRKFSPLAPPKSIESDRDRGLARALK